ncbi:ATP-binding protein [Streptomyces sp. NPDC052013]|uniref:ATP-binding protein n=1 Tax=Streptomyces sp. NPDC052013 TaxID=3365679 RepID=UPI0037D86F04
MIQAAEEEDEEHESLHEAHVRNAEQARIATRAFLAEVGPIGGPDAEAVLLVASELVTNAVRHAGGVTRFRLVAGPGTVTVTVEDASATAPRRWRRTPDEPCGAGWRLVRQLAEDVEVSTRPGGKSVSAVVPLPPET